MSAPENSIVETISQSGWVIALLTGTWGVVLRFVIGRYAQGQDRLESRLRGIEDRIAVIEDRSLRRRREDTR